MYTVPDTLRLHLIQGDGILYLVYAQNDLL